MALTRKKIVDKAREFIGTPWQHGAKVKGEGIDCAQLLIAIFQELGEPIEDFYTYSMQDEFEVLLTILDKYCVKVDDIVDAGDLLVFRERLMWNHCGIYTGLNTFIHAYASPAYNRVMEQSFSEEWKFRVREVYRYKKVKN